jgi:carbon-monoxide dehydrogenase medium subunit
VKPASFEYHRPRDVEESLKLIARLGEDAKFLAGGQSLVPMMNFRLARPAALVDISRLAELEYIVRDETGLKIGALTRHRAIETADLEGYELLPSAVRWIGHYPIRTVGTVGGSIAHADPTAEWCILATLLDAEIVTRGPAGERTIPAASFFLGYMLTALEPGELIVEVRLPPPVRNAAFQEFARRRGDFAIVAAAVALDVHEGTCTSARIALGGVDATPLRIAEAEQLLTGARIGDVVVEEVGEIAARTIEPWSDTHATADYRRRLASVLVGRALREAANGN